MNRRRQRRQQGFTLVELMVAMSLGLMLSWLVVDVYINSSRSQAVLLRNQQLNESGRYLAELLRREISAAGFYGYTAAVPSAQTEPEPLCQLLDSAPASQQLSYPLLGVDNATASLTCSDQRNSATASDLSSCTAQSDLTLTAATGSDLLLLRRVAFTPSLAEATGSRAVNRELDSCQHYLLSAPDGATLVKFVKGDGSSRQLTDGAVWRYLEDIFYTTATGQFQRVYLDQGRFKSSRTIAEGVEDFQLEYGIDSDGDGIADSWTTAPQGAAQWAAVVVVNYYLLLVAEAARADTAAQTFNYAGKQRVADDGRMRQLFSGSVRLASPAMRRAGQ